MHYTLASSPGAYLRSTAVKYSDLVTVLTDDSYSLNSKVLAVCHPMADLHVWDLACQLDIGNVNEALLSLGCLPPLILMRLAVNEDHYIRAVTAKHRNATEEVLMLLKNDSHPIVQQALNSRC